MEKFYKLFDINIAVGSREELYSRCSDMIGRGCAVATVNPEILAEAARNHELRTALSESLCIPDGIGVALMLRRLGCKTERLPGVELGEELLEGERCVKLAIIGGREGIAEAAMQNLVMRHRNVIPEFTASGYDMDCEYIGRQLSDTRPDIVFVCLGSPKQELFISRMRKFSEKTLFLGLGGSADIYSGEKQRAPRIMRAVGAEWLWRVVCEPKRITRLMKSFSFFMKSAKNSRKSVKIGKKIAKSG